MAAVHVINLLTLGLWQNPASKPLPPVPLIPDSCSRLALPVYGAEHLLQFRRTDDESDADVLPVLLRYREGEQLEQLGDVDQQFTSSAAIGVECAARGKLLSAIVRRPLAPWDLLKLGDGCASFTEALLKLLEREGWRPNVLQLGAAAGKSRYREDDVGMRDMGANTPAAPSSVRVGELLTALRCTRIGGDEQLALELEGPGEAVLLARVGGVPLEATAATWEKRAQSADRLPELRPESRRDLSGLFARS